MTDHTFSIPEDLYEQAQRVAQQTARSIDEVIQARLKGAFYEPLSDLPEDERDELRSMAYLSDDTLWTIAREQFPPVPQARLSLLMDKNSQGSLTDDERNELEALVERGDRLMLRKSQAMKLLTERGFSPSEL